MGMVEGSQAVRPWLDLAGWATGVNWSSGVVTRLTMQEDRDLGTK